MREKSSEYIRKNDLVAINIADVIHIAHFVGQICEYHVDSLNENKLRWCVVTNEMDMYLFDAFDQPYAKKLKLTGYKIHLRSQSIGYYQYFIIRLYHQDSQAKFIDFIIDNKSEVVKWLNLFCTATNPDKECKL